MNDPKLHFRAVLIDILDRLSDNERQKLSFLSGEDIERRIRDDPTIGGTLNLFQQLFDRQKISEENFSYLIQAFQAIKCHEAAKSLTELQKNLLKNRLAYDSGSDPSNSALISTCSTAATSSSSPHTTTNSDSSFLDEWIKDQQEEKMSSRHISQMADNFNQITNNNTKIPISVVSVLTPAVAQVQTAPSLSRIRKIENIDSSQDGIYCSRKRLIFMIIITVLLLLLISTIVFLYYQKSISKPPITTPSSRPMSSTYTLPLSSRSSRRKTTSPIILITDSNEEEDKCRLPHGNSCTDSTPKETEASGLGVYFQHPCDGVGCGFLRPECRLCWIDPKAPGKMDRLKCPKCVIDRQRRARIKDPKCQLPVGNSCTSLTPKHTKEEGLGVYYQNPCVGVGCGFLRSHCRLCWINPNATGRMDRPQCPKCVTKF